MRRAGRRGRAASLLAVFADGLTCVSDLVTPCAPTAAAPRAREAALDTAGGRARRSSRGARAHVLCASPADGGARAVGARRAGVRARRAPRHCPTSSSLRRRWPRPLPELTPSSSRPARAPPPSLGDDGATATASTTRPTSSASADGRRRAPAARASRSTRCAAPPRRASASSWRSRAPTAPTALRGTRSLFEDASLRRRSLAASRSCSSSERSAYEDAFRGVEGGDGGELRLLHPSCAGARGRGDGGAAGGGGGARPRAAAAAARGPREAAHIAGRRTEPPPPP